MALRFERPDLSNPVVMAQIKTHPSLKVSDGKISRWSLASKNAKLLLKAAFPHVVFEVKSSQYTGGSSLDIRWHEYADAPTSKQVDDVVRIFSYENRDGNPDRDPQRQAFREAFGRVRFVMPQIREMSREQQVAHESGVLREAMSTDEPPTASRTARARL